MKRIGMTLAAVVVGGVLLTTSEAAACEGHRAKAEKAASKEVAPAKTDKADELHAAKCQCGSAADCTCKKGTCECARCKKPRREVVAPLKAEGQVPAQPKKARLDASAGLFI